MWDAWWYGDNAAGIGPFRHFLNGDMWPKVNKVNLSKARKVMDSVIKKAKELELLVAQGENDTVAEIIGRMSKPACDNVFDQAFTELAVECEINILATSSSSSSDGSVQPPRSKKRKLRRVGEAQYNTVYRWLGVPPPSNSS